MTQDGKTRITGSVELLANQRIECAICASYARLRGKRIRDEIHRTTPPVDRYAAWTRFMAGVHQRHLAPGRPSARSKETR